MTLLTPDDLREHITTSLVDAALNRVLDDSEFAITAFGGPLGSVTELVRGGGDRIVTSRPIDTVSAITERDGSQSEVALAVDDWELSGRFVLWRLQFGTNSAGYWRGPVRVTYTAEDDTATRKMVQLDLVKLEIAFNPALASETVGAWTQTYVSSLKTYPEQRADILSRLREVAGFAVVGG